MSQPPFNNLKNSYADPRQPPACMFSSEATVNEGNHAPGYGLGIMEHNSYPSPRFYPISPMDYQQDNQLVIGPILHDMPITDRSLEQNSYSLLRSPAAETFSTVPNTQVTESTISRPGRINSYQYLGNCTGNSEFEHRRISESQQLPSVADRGSDAQTMSSQPRQNKHPCPVDGCKRVGDKGFSRKDNLRQHLRGVHGKNIPKQRRAAHGGV